jgi:FlaA1/EpsC-like NDP-sugar epimerase
VAQKNQTSASELDFSLDDTRAQPGWLRQISRGQIETFAKLADLAIIAAACAAASAATQLGPAAILAPAAIILAALLAFIKCGLYGIDRLMEPARAMRPLTAAWTLIFTLTAALPLLTHQNLAPRAWLLAFYATGLVALVITRWAFEPLIRAWVAHGHCTKLVAIVGANEAAVQLIRRLRHNPHGIRIAGVYDDRAAPAPNRISPLSRLGTVADLAASPQQIDLVVITLPLTETARIAAIIAQLRGKPTKLRILPGLIGLDPLSPIRLQRTELPGIQLIEVK